MYHSLLRIHLIGFDADMADVVEKTAPPTSFTRQVTASPALGAAPADDPAVSQADGLFLRVADADGLAAVESLLAARKPGADLVLIAPNDLAAAAEPFLGQLTDLWADPRHARFPLRALAAYP